MVKEGRIKKKAQAFTVSWSKVSTCVLVGSGDDRTERCLVILIDILSIIWEVKYDNIVKSIKVFQFNERNISNRNGVGIFKNKGRVIVMVEAVFLEIFIEVKMVILRVVFNLIDDRGDWWWLICKWRR